MSRGPAGRRGYEPDNNGISAYRYLMTDCQLRCGDALHDDTKYAAEVMRWRRQAAPSINRWWKRWVELRDGYTDTEQGKVVGFWVDGNGELLKPGARVPKDANIGMEGAIMQILHYDGIYWVKERQKSRTKAAYADVIKKRKLEEPGDEDQDDEDELEDDEKV